MHKLLGVLLPIGVYTAMWLFELESSADPKNGRIFPADLSTGMTLAYIGDRVLDQAGHGLWLLLMMNGGGYVVLIAVAHLIAWFGTKPWKNGHFSYPMDDRKPPPRRSFQPDGLAVARTSSDWDRF